jgi:hypothetical protein
LKSIVVSFFMVVACLGFVVSLAVHLTSVFGVSLFPREPWFLHIGIFVVWLPAILCSQALTKEFPQSQTWKAALRGCPKAMQYGLYGVVAYAFLNFALFLVTTAEDSRSSAAMIRGFSGHWLVFYYAAFAILFSYLQVQKQDPARRCQNGHVVALAAKFCADCGSPVGDVLTGRH